MLDEIGTTAARRATWEKGLIPTIKNTDEIFVLLRCTRLDAVRAARLNLSLRPPLVNPGNDWGATLHRYAYQTKPPHPLQALPRDTQSPASTPATRFTLRKYWNTTITWAIANRMLDKILPMNQSTLQALLWDLTSLGASLATLKNVATAIFIQHKQARLPNPVNGHFCYKHAKTTLRSMLDHPRTNTPAVTRDMVAQLLRSNTTSAIDLRNKLACCTMTIGIMRPSNGSRAQTCDYANDANPGTATTQPGPGFTLRTLFRKNDQIRKGHEMRFGKSVQPDLDINFQLGLLMDLLGTRPRPGCTKSTAPDGAASYARPYSRNFNLTPPASTFSPTTQRPRLPSCPPWS